MFNITAPNFFKNLIFNGGPKINENVVHIKNIEYLNQILIALTNISVNMEYR